MVVLPLAEILLRRFAGTGIPGSIPFVQHLVLWVGFLGAALAAREGTMLALATGTFLPAGRARDWADTFAATVAAAVSTMLCVGAFELMMSEREAGTVIAAGVTTWVAQTVLPFAFGLIALRTVWRTKGGWASRAIAACGMVAGGMARMAYDRDTSGGISVAARRRASGRSRLRDSDLRRAWRIGDRPVPH